MRMRDGLWMALLGVVIGVGCQAGGGPKSPSTAASANAPRYLPMTAAASMAASRSRSNDGVIGPGAQAGSAPTPETSSAEDLAKKLSNPVAALISVPFQLNYDQDIGSGDEGERWQLNVQPVVPVTLDEHWNVISRTILPILDQSDVPPGNDDSGIGDILQSLFFSPKEPTASGVVWGVGPVFLLPTASHDTLGGEKWGAGPTGVVLKQAGPWTLGGLANHVWSFAGDDDRSDVDSTFLQPFAAYTTPDAWTFTLNSESTYDWKHSDWSVPLNALASKLVHLGGLPVSIGGGARYWAESADGGPEGWGIRFVVTLLFPK